MPLFGFVMLRLNSASSRFLDLVSELKPQSDEGKASENIYTQTKTSEHPWGL